MEDGKRREWGQVRGMEGWGCRRVISNHMNPPQVHTKAEHLQRCRLRPRPATGQTDHKQDLLTSFLLIMNCALPAVLF